MTFEWRDLVDEEKGTKCEECGKEAAKICTHCNKGFCSPECGTKHYDKLGFDYVSSVEEKKS